MGKKFSTLVFVLIAALIAWQTYASKPWHDGADLGIGANLKFGQPSTFIAYGRCGNRADADMDVTLPEGIQLLKGKLHSHASIDSPYVYLHEMLTILIDKPGTYEITNTLRITKFSDTNVKNLPTSHYTVYLYASKENVFDFGKRSEMEQAIRDSLVFPGVATRRAKERDEEQFFRASARQNLPPYATSTDLAYAVTNLRLLSDSIPYPQLSDFYDSNQVILIKKQNLLYSPPRYDLVEHLLSLDFMGRISDEQVHELAEIMKRQMAELYDFDQKIIKLSVPWERNYFQRNKCLRERKALIEKQYTERKAVLETK